MRWSRYEIFSPYTRSSNISSQPLVLLGSHTKKTYQKVYEKINKKYKWIVHVMFYQHTKF
jgi:hypothetical protein